MFWIIKATYCRYGDQVMKDSEKGCSLKCALGFSVIHYHYKNPQIITFTKDWNFDWCKPVTAEIQILQVGKFGNLWRNSGELVIIQIQNSQVHIIPQCRTETFYLTCN